MTCPQCLRKDLLFLTYNLFLADTTCTIILHSSRLFETPSKKIIFTTSGFGLLVRGKTHRFLPLVHSNCEVYIIVLSGNQEKLDSILLRCLLSGLIKCGWWNLRLVAYILQPMDNILSTETRQFIKTLIDSCIIHVRKVGFLKLDPGLPGILFWYQITKTVIISVGGLKHHYAQKCGFKLRTSISSWLFYQYFMDISQEE